MDSGPPAQGVLDLFLPGGAAVGEEFRFQVHTARGGCFDVSYRRQACARSPHPGVASLRVRVDGSVECGVHPEAGERREE